MIHSLFQDFVWRMGYRLARQQVARAMYWGSDPDAFEREESSNFWKRRSVDMSFENGYSAGWAEVGEQDAREGICRAIKFRNHGYNLGWRSQMAELRSKEWRHAALEKEYEIMEKYYWNKIASGKTHEYYEFFKDRT